MQSLLNAEALRLTKNILHVKDPGARSAMGELYLPLDGLIDVEAEKVRMNLNWKKFQRKLQRYQQSLNPNFTERP